MANESISQTNFTAGELSPRLLARSDIAKYRNGCETLVNMLVLPHGGAERRHGTKYAAEVKDSTKKTRLIPFEFSTDQAFIIELGDKYIRFYKNNAQIMDGGSPYEIQSPFLEAELFEVQFAQSADIMWLTHNNVKTQKLSRLADTNWTLTTYEPTADPFLGTDQNITAATQANPCVITIVGHGYSNGQRISITGVVGMTELNGITYHVANVTANTFELEGIDSTAYTAYVSGGVSEIGNNNFPACVSFFEQRICFGNTTNDPHKVWLSQSANYENLTTGTSDSDAITYIIASGKVNRIRWLAGVNDLLIGTSGGEYRASGGNNNPITPTNISVKRQTNNRCAFIQPVEIDNAVVYVQRTGKKVRELSYDFSNNQYISPDISILSEHITGNGIDQIDYSQEPDSIIWMVREDGTLLSLTYVKDHEVVAWGRHTTDGTYESVAIIPAATHDEIWVVVKRNINGSDVRYVEYFTADTWTAQEDAYYVDSGITYDGAATDTITGLTHLEGETVALLGDGAVYPTFTVSSGQITGIDPTVSKASVGLAYTHQLDTLEPEGGNPAGSAQGKTKTYDNIKVRLYQTLGGQINGKDILYRSVDDNMDTAPPLFTGDYIVPSLGHSTKETVSLTSSDPAPFTILGIYRNVNTADD